MKLKFKILTDLALTALFALEIAGTLLPTAFHEIAGLALAALLLVHFALNAGWIGKALRRSGRAGASERDKALLAADIVLAVGSAVSTVSGLLVSQVVTGLALGGAMSWLHGAASYASFGALLVHIAMHAKYLAAGIKRLFSGLAGRLAASAAALALAAAVIWGIAADEPTIALKEESVYESFTTAASSAETEETTDEKKETAASASPLLPLHRRPRSPRRKRFR